MRTSFKEITPSVFGLGVQLATWRNEDSGSFFILGEFSGSSLNPTTKLKVWLLRFEWRF